MRRLPLALCLAAAACGGPLPEGTTSFTAGRVTVRTDSVLDLVGVVFRLADTAAVPRVGPARTWLQTLSTELGDSAFALARALGAAPVGAILANISAPQAGPDSACGLVAPGLRRCFRGGEESRAAAQRFIAAARALAPRASALALTGLDARARRRDLGDVYRALTVAKSLDSVVAAYSGYGDLVFDVTLARTFPTGQTSPPMDPGGAQAGDTTRLFLAPDAVFLKRSYRNIPYIWLALGHQMAHAVVQRLFRERPDLVEHSVRLREVLEPMTVRSGYSALFADEVVGEQLARAITVRIVSQSSPTILWAVRTEAVNTNMALVPWLEAALERYETQRARYPTLSAFGDELVRALDSIPMDSCRAAPSPGVALVAAGPHRAVVGWIGPGSPFRDKGLREGDTVLVVDGDSASASSLLLPTRQLMFAFSDHLIGELATLEYRRNGRVWGAHVPIDFVLRPTVRAPDAPPAAAEPPICAWVRRAVRS